MSSVRDRMNAFQNGNATNGGQQPRPSYSNAVRRTPGTGGNKPVETHLEGPVVDAVKRILDTTSATNWLILSYDRGVNLIKEGDGDFEAFKNSLIDDAVLYGYLRQPIGLDRRMKFVFVKWIGENVRPIQRARALDDYKRIQSGIKVYHLELSANKKSDLTEKNIVDRLQAAAGANYDKEQNANPALGHSQNEFSSYKRTSKQFFQNIEKNTTLKAVVYETKALPKTTPVDLGGRAMTVGASLANKNVVDLKIQKEGGSNSQDGSRAELQEAAL